MYDFITIGGTTRDISFFTAEGLLINNYNRDILHQHVLAFESGAKIKVDKFYYSYGGGAANAAVCLANLGFKTACLAPIGGDADGDMITRNLKEHGIATRFIQRKAKEESGSSFILIAPSGERIIFAQRGANMLLDVDHKSLAAIKYASNIYIASLSGRWQEQLKKIFSVVGPEGPRVFWNPGMTQYLEGVDAISEYLPKVAVLASNKDEAVELVMTSRKYRRLGRSFLNNPENIVKIMHSFGPKIAVITLGASGVIAYDGKTLYRRPIIKAQKVVDTTGVGDIFKSFAAGCARYG